MKQVKPPASDKLPASNRLLPPKSPLVGLQVAKPLYEQVAAIAHRERRTITAQCCLLIEAGLAATGETR